MVPQDDSALNFLEFYLLKLWYQSAKDRRCYYMSILTGIFDSPTSLGWVRFRHYELQLMGSLLKELVMRIVYMWSWVASFQHSPSKGSAAENKIVMEMEPSRVI